MSVSYNHAETPAHTDSDQLPQYWIAQMDKAHMYSALAALYGDCPVSIHASHETLALALQNLCHIKIVYSTLAGGIHQVASALDNGAVVIQFRHGESDWTRGHPELVTHKSRIGYVNIAAYLILTKKAGV